MLIAAGTLVAPCGISIGFTGQNERDGTRIRATGAQVIAGVLDQEDAVAMNAPLREQRDLAKLQLGALPAKREEPGADEIDADAFRAAVLEAWTDQPLEERRSALAQLLRKITLSPGGVKSTYGYCHHEPAGPPEGSAPINRRWVLCGDVSRPKVYVTAAL